MYTHTRHVHCAANEDVWGGCALQLQDTDASDGGGGRGQGDFKGTCTAVLGFCFLERVEANLAKMIDVGKSRWWMHEVYYVSSL